MKRILGVVGLLILAWPVTGSALVSLNGPETIVYDSVGDRYFVSNMQTDQIVQIDRQGSYSLFSTAVNHPYGMAIQDNVLYVGGDRGGRGGITGIDLSTGAMVFEHLSSAWYYCVNGVTADTSGHIFFACTGASSILRVDVQSSTSGVIATIPIPNAVLFDVRENRLIVTTNQWGSSLYAVNLGDYSVSTIPFRYGQFSGLTQDRLRNLYVAYFAGGIVYRVDSTLAGTIETLSTGHQGPEGICFDRDHGVLCVPNLMANSISFLPQQTDLWIVCDSTHGWVPFEVSFTGASTLDISSWSWDFGDGQGASGPVVQHTYDQAGTHEVKLQAVTAGGDTLHRIYFNPLGCLADSVWTEDLQIEADTGTEVAEVVIHVRNHVPVREFRIPVVYDGELELEYDTILTAGCRSELFEGQVVTDLDTASKRLTIRLAPREAGLPLYADPGYGPMVRVRFLLPDPASHTSTSVSVDGYGAPHMPSFVAQDFDYSPITVGGLVEYTHCCQGLRGNVNGDIGETIDATDLISLVTYVFKSGLAPSCLSEADVNGSGSTDASDLIHLVNYVFKSGPDPAGCE